MIENQNFTIRECEILVIGAGGAGLRAAIAAAESGKKVIVVTKTLLGKAHTVMAEGGIAASIGSVDDADDWKSHFTDTMQKGQYLSNPEMVEVYTKEAPKRVMELEEWGALFDRTEDGKILQRPFGGHTHRRVCHVGDRTGLEILRTLQDKAIQYSIEYMQEVFITKIFVKDNGKKATGALLINLKTGKFEYIKFKAVIIAAGGLGRMYKITSNSGETTGNGFSLALNAGVELKDMEMIQFHPTGMVWPTSAQGMLVTEAVRGEGGILTNSQGERFMPRYDPKLLELSSRDVVARANYHEITAGRGTEHGGVFLDISFKGEKFIKTKLGRMYEQFMEFANVDITKSKMEVAPTCHYMMGGINVSGVTCSTNIKGIFAAGEIAAGLHGANRLGGNSLSDILVFGKRAGEMASKYCSEVSKSSGGEHNIKLQSRIVGKNNHSDKLMGHDIGKRQDGNIDKEVDVMENTDIGVRKNIEKEIERLENFLGESELKVSVIRDKMQQVMWENVSIIRNNTGLTNALSEIKILQKEILQCKAKNVKIYNPEWIQILDVQNMLDIAEIIIRSALIRTESRGAHTRDDYPDKIDKWRKNIVFKKGSNGLSQKFEKSVSMEPRLQELVGEND